MRRGYLYRYVYLVHCSPFTVDTYGCLDGRPYGYESGDTSRFMLLHVEGGVSTGLLAARFFNIGSSHFCESGRWFIHRRFEIFLMTGCCLTGRWIVVLLAGLAPMHGFQREQDNHQLTIVRYQWEDDEVGDPVSMSVRAEE